MSQESVILATALIAFATAAFLLRFSRAVTLAHAQTSTSTHRPRFRPGTPFGRDAAAMLYATATLPRAFSYASVTKKMALSKN